MQQTSILQDHQVWDLAALLLAAASFPICLLPIRLIRKDYRRSTSSRQQRRHHMHLLILWIAITVSHVLLMMFPLVGMLEQVCDDGSQVSLETANQFLKKCKRSYVNTLVEAIEVLTLPVYPALMVSTYMQLLPTTTRQRVVRVAHSVNATLSALTLSYFALMMAQRLLYFTAPTTSANQLHTSFWIADLPHLVFFVWFFAMVFIGLFALVLALRLLPYLDVSAQRAAASASGLGQGSSPKAVFLRLGRKSLDRLTAAAPAGSNTSTTAVVAASSTPALATGRVQACVRRLKILLASMLSLLILCSLMVVFDSFPRVMYVTSGWVCGRALTVVLFVATREIKHAVKARRLVPSNAVGVTLAATAWSGHESGQDHGRGAEDGGDRSELDTTTVTQAFASRSVSDARNGPNISGS